MNLIGFYQKNLKPCCVRKGPQLPFNRNSGCHAQVTSPKLLPNNSPVVECSLPEPDSKLEEDSRSTKIRGGMTQTEARYYGHIGHHTQCH